MLIKFICPEALDHFDLSEIVNLSSFIESHDNNFENIRSIIYPHLTNKRDLYDYEILDLYDKPDENGDLEVKTWLKKRRIYNKWHGLNVFYSINWSDKFHVSKITSITEDLLLKYGISPDILRKTATVNINRLSAEIMGNITGEDDISIHMEPRYKNIFCDIIYSHLFWIHLYKILKKPFYFLYKSEYEFEILDKDELESKDEIEAMWGKLFFYTGSELRSLSLPST